MNVISGLICTYNIYLYTYETIKRPMKVYHDYVCPSLIESAWPSLSTEHSLQFHCETCLMRWVVDKAYSMHSKLSIPQHPLCVSNIYDFLGFLTTTTTQTEHFVGAHMHVHFFSFIKKIKNVFCSQELHAHTHTERHTYHTYHTHTNTNIIYTNLQAWYINWYSTSCSSLYNTLFKRNRWYTL